MLLFSMSAGRSRLSYVLGLGGGCWCVVCALCSPYALATESTRRSCFYPKFIVAPIRFSALGGVVCALRSMPCLGAGHFRLSDVYCRPHLSLW